MGGLLNGQGSEAVGNAQDGSHEQIPDGEVAALAGFFAGEIAPLAGGEEVLDASPILGGRGVSGCGDDFSGGLEEGGAGEEAASPSSKNCCRLLISASRLCWVRRCR